MITASNVWIFLLNDKIKLTIFNMSDIVMCGAWWPVDSQEEGGRVVPLVAATKV